MLKEGLKTLSGVYWKVIYVVATAGTTVMVVSFFANRLELAEVTFWQSLTVILPTAMFLGFLFTLTRMRGELNLLYDVGLYVLVGNAFLSSEEEAQDEMHRIDTTEQKVDLTNNATDVTVSERYVGRNIRNEESEYFKFYYNSETFIDDDNTTVKQVIDGNEEVELEVEKIADSGSFTGVYKAYFREPLGRNESFELRIRSQLDSWDLSDGQYVYWDFNRFQNGVDEARCTVEVDTAPETFSAYRAVDHTETIHHNDPKKLDFEIETVDVVERRDGQQFDIEPTGIVDEIYVIDLEWQDPSTANPAT